MAHRLAVVTAEASCVVCGGRARPSGTGSFPAEGKKIATEFYFCAGCDLFWRRIPTQTQTLRFEHAGYTAAYNRRKLLLRRRAFFDFLLTLVEERSAHGAQRLLDVGASYGHLMTIARRRGMEVAGVEIVSRLREDIERRLHAPCWGDLDAVDGLYDVVSFIDSFYYFDDPLAALTSTGKLLRPGGIVVFRVSNRNLLVRGLGLVGSDRGFSPLGDHFMGWSLKAMRRALTLSGFEVVDVRVYEQGWRRPLRQWVLYGPSVALSAVTKRWDQAVSPGIIVVAKKL